MNIDFAALCGLSPNPYIVIGPDETIVWTNDAYLRSTMREGEALLGQRLFDAFPSEPGSESHELLRASLDRVIATRQPDEIAMIRYDISTPDGVMEQRYWSATHTPLLDEEGNLAFILQHTVDVTELADLRRLRDEMGVVRRASAVQARNLSLEAERSWLTGLFKQAPGFIAVLDGSDFTFEMANDAYLKLVGRESLIGLPIVEALPEVVGQGFVNLLNDVRTSGQAYIGHAIEVDLEVRPGAALERRYLDFIYQPIFEDGQATAILVQGHDVTEGVLAQKQQEVLINELHHRVKNTLVIVQSLATQSFRGLPSSDKARHSFDERLMALAGAHDLLTQRNWEGASLKGLVLQTISAAAGPAMDRVAVEGDDVPLSPRLAVALTMAFHELTTNAIKYGALSNHEGSIAVSWTQQGQDGALHLDWVEAGGPTVVLPERRGFGSRLIEGGVGAARGCRAVIEYDHTGVRCRMTLSLS